MKDSVWSVLTKCIVLVIVLAGCEAGNTRHGPARVRIRKLLPKSFANVKINPHNEVELKLGFDRVIATEISQRNAKVPDFSISIRQATDGKRLVQAVIQNGVMKECDFTKDIHQIQAFVDSFMESNDFNLAEFGDVFTVYNSDQGVSETNETLANKYFNSALAPEEFSHFVDIRMQRKQCRNFTKTAKAVAKQEAKLIRSGEYLNAYDSKTNTFHAAIYARQVELAEQYGISLKDNKGVRTITKRAAPNDVTKRSRTKRGAFDFSSVLIFPGTKWCGKGDLATCFDDLGDDRELDECCRDHDCCPFVIPPLSSNFGTFNYRFHSLLHCECDQRFRGCLRKSPSSTADMIGKIYFNILGSPCFQFEEVEVCAERAWYGYCRRYETQVKAVVKSQKSFYEECASRNDSTTTMTAMTTMMMNSASSSIGDRHGSSTKSITPTTPTTTPTTTMSNEIKIDPGMNMDATSSDKKKLSKSNELKGN